MQTRKEIAAMGGESHAAGETIQKQNYTAKFLSKLNELTLLDKLFWLAITGCLIGGLL